MNNGGHLYTSAPSLADRAWIGRSWARGLARKRKKYAVRTLSLFGPDLDTFKRTMNCLGKGRE